MAAAHTLQLPALSSKRCTQLPPFPFARPGDAATCVAIPKEHLQPAAVQSFCLTRRAIFVMRGSRMHIPFMWEYLCHAAPRVVTPHVVGAYMEWLELVNKFRLSHVLGMLADIHRARGIPFECRLAGSKLLFASPLASIAGSVTVRSDIDVTLFQDVTGDIWAQHRALFGEESLECMFDVNFYLQNFETPTALLPPGDMATDDAGCVRYVYEGVEYSVVRNVPDEVSLAFSLTRLAHAVGVHDPLTGPAGRAWVSSSSAACRRRDLVSLSTLDTVDQYHTCSTYKHVVIVMMRRVPLSRDEVLESVYENMGFFAKNVMHAPCYTELFANLVKGMKYLMRVYTAACAYCPNELALQRREAFNIMESVRVSQAVPADVSRACAGLLDALAASGAAMSAPVLRAVFGAACFVDDRYGRPIAERIVASTIVELHVGIGVPFTPAIVAWAQRAMARRFQLRDLVPFARCLSDVQARALTP